MFSDLLSNLHFWGWQLIIYQQQLLFHLGLTSSHEYAELIWPIDLAIAVVWIVFGINMFGTILKRREQHLYVAIWFYIATWITVTVLHVFNNIQIPVSIRKWNICVCGCPGCIDSMVVRSQCGGIFPYDALSWA
jgi:cytochrome c oxidase cbb3-type subunit I/II